MWFSHGRGKRVGGGTETEKIYVSFLYAEGGGKEHKTQVSVSVSGDWWVEGVLIRLYKSLRS